MDWSSFFTSTFWNGFLWTATTDSNLQSLINKLISYLAPIAMTICILVAVIMTIVAVLNGMVDTDAQTRKNTVKRIIWIWGCALVIFLIPTLALILKQEFVNLAG